MTLAFSIAGFAILVYRLGPTLFAKSQPIASAGRTIDQAVSIIIPARNEESNLPRLLRSLEAVKGENIEIIVVDDNSTDRTREIAQNSADARVRVIENSPRPEGWNGKTWACQNGGLAARGDWLLFTDADTEHLADSLSKMLALDCDMASALPFHDDEGWFGRLMGPFHMLVFICSSAFSKPKAGAVFSIGQYLLFKREQYLKQGTHEAVKMSFSEDLELAEQCYASGGHYGLESSGQIFKVRMYDSLAAFLAGWRRIFRLGFAHASFWRTIEVFLVIAVLTESFKFARATMAEAVLACLSIVLLALVQRRYGRFSWLGALLAPLGLAVFTYLSVLALFDRVLKRDLRWRGRSYKLTA